MRFMGDTFVEFARIFRHVAAIAATSSFCLLAGSAIQQFSSVAYAEIYTTAFFVAAVVPVAALAVRQAIHILIDVRDPHEPFRDPPSRSSQNTTTRVSRAARSRSGRDASSSLSESMQTGPGEAPLHSTTQAAATQADPLAISHLQSLSPSYSQSYEEREERVAVPRDRDASAQ